jgi:phosphoribosylamine--glycine ligase
VRVVEFNARFGDPETQPLLALLASPLAVVLLAAAEGRLAELGPLGWLDGAAVAVVMAADGYPSTPRTGDVVDGIATAAAHDGVTVLQAGTAYDGRGRVVTAGGRVLAVTAVGLDVADARAKAYAAADVVRFAGAQLRTDIALAAARAEAPA